MIGFVHFTGAVRLFALLLLLIVWHFVRRRLRRRQKRRLARWRLTMCDAIEELY